MRSKTYSATTLLLTLLVASAHAQFEKIPIFDKGAGWNIIVKADLNHDGKPDIVGSSGNRLAVMAALGNGAHGFGAVKLSSVTNLDTPGLLAVGDFNNDGFPDVVVPGTDHVTGGAAVGIMLGNGDGTFQTTTEITVGGSGFVGVVITGDFNGDGNSDIALLNGGTITVLLGKGNGSFGSPITSTSDGDVGCAAVGDFNNDGKLDLTNGTSVYLGNGDGTFQSPITVPGGACNVATADFKHDGNLGLLTGSSDGRASVYLGNGTGHFSNPTQYGHGNVFAVADFNGDGFPDFALGTNADTDIFLNKGNGTFSPGYSYLGGATNPVAGTFGSNSKEDLVIVYGFPQQGLAVLVGLGDGSFKDYVVLPGEGRGDTMAADFNGDHKLDLLTSRGVLLGKGKAEFRPVILLPQGCSAATLGDFRGDGKLDIAGIYNNQVVVCLGNGNGEFNGPKTYDQGIQHELVLAGDFNNDGILDLAASDQHGVSVLLGSGDGTFQNGIPTAVNASFPTFILGDFNHDGNLDLAAITGDTISVLLGKGNGSFGSPVITNISGVIALAAGDLNSDGNLDLVVSAGQSIDVLLGKGNGSFKAPISYPAFSPVTIVLADFNGDGKLDVALRSQPLQVRYGNGDGTLQPANGFPVFGLNGSSLLAGDFVGDGRLDLVTATDGFHDELIILLPTP